MTTVDLHDVKRFLTHTERLSDTSVKRVMTQLRKLVTGEGLTHRKRPGEVFCAGRVITLDDNLLQLKFLAKRWMPNRYDTTHAWGLVHPIQKLILYKKWKIKQARLATSDAA